MSVSKSFVKEAPVAVIVHGSPSKPKYPTQHDKHWLPYLKKELEEWGYQVITPELPQANSPIYVDWVKELERSLGDRKLDNKSVVVGHSAGCSFVTRYLSEKGVKVNSIILVAPSKLLPPDDKDLHERLEALYTFQPKKGIADRMLVIYSTDDRDRIIESSRYFIDFYNAESIKFTDKGHLTERFGVTELPEAVEWIKKSSQSKQKILIGTRNKAKVNMIRSAFKQSSDIKLVTLDDLPDEVDDSDLVEGDDFQENARIKAEFYFKKTGLPTIATDHILWMENWPKDDGFIIHLRKEANPKTGKATDQEAVDWLEQYLKKTGETRAAFHHAVAYVDGEHKFDYVSIQREYKVGPKYSEKKQEGYIVDRFMRDAVTGEFKIEQPDEVAYDCFFKSIRSEFIPKINKS